MIVPREFSHLGSSRRADAALVPRFTTVLDKDSTSLCRPETLQYSGRSCFGDTTSTQTLGRAVIIWATCHYRLSAAAPQSGGRDVHLRWCKRRQPHSARFVDSLQPRTSPATRHLRLGKVSRSHSGA